MARNIQVTVRTAQGIEMMAPTGRSELMNILPSMAHMCWLSYNCYNSKNGYYVWL